MSTARCFRNTFEQPSSISIDDADKRGLEQAILEGIDVRYLLPLLSCSYGIGTFDRDAPTRLV